MAGEKFNGWRNCSCPCGPNRVDLPGNGYHRISENDVFLEYLSEFDPEGYQILTDPALSDKAIWAPTNEAFAKLGVAPESASPEEIKTVLSFHMTPPRRTPKGDYPMADRSSTKPVPVFSPNLTDG